jgi:Phage derived protein Gp49-like (DUF891)
MVEERPLPMAYLFQAYVSPAGQTWMVACHPQQDVLTEVLSDLILRIHMVQALGPSYGSHKDQPIKKLAGFDDMWESRVRHPSGLYRQFFRFTSVAGQRSAAFVDGAVKKGRRLPRHTMEAAARRLDDYVAELHANPNAQARDRVK